jgi:plasmid stability protein
MDQLLVLARIAQPRSRAARHGLSIALAAVALAGCGGGDEPASDEEQAAEVAKRYVSAHSNSDEAECRKTLADGVLPGLCDDAGPLASRVNPEAERARIDGTTAVVTVTGAGNDVLLDITLAKERDEWKVRSWRGYTK